MRKRVLGLGARNVRRPRALKKPLALFAFPPRGASLRLGLVEARSLQAGLLLSPSCTCGLSSSDIPLPRGPRNASGRSREWRGERQTFKGKSPKKPDQ